MRLIVPCTSSLATITCPTGAEDKKYTTWRIYEPRGNLFDCCEESLVQPWIWWCTGQCSLYHSRWALGVSYWIARITIHYSLRMFTRFSMALSHPLCIHKGYHHTCISSDNRVVIQLSGDSISAAQAQELASLLSDQSSAFTLEIVEVTVSDGDSDDSEALLSSPAIIGIAVGASVIGLVPIFLLSAILVMCLVNRNGRTRRQEKYRWANCAILSP